MIQNELDSPFGLSISGRLLAESLEALWGAKIDDLTLFCCEIKAGFSVVTGVNGKELDATDTCDQLLDSTN